MKPSIPKGTRDFSPTEMVRRNYIFDTIRTIFQRYGYLPIETPAMENLETLMGKYGEEGDKLIFKILNSGDYLEKLEAGSQKLEAIDSKRLTNLISEKALRYDLTVPFARYVVQHQNDITFPFKRYQIQPVWRADRPQKGRYREFYQCDADVVGSDSLLNEVELVQMMDDVFTALRIPVSIKVNNRKILSGIAQYLGVKNDFFINFVTAIDKIDKVGFDVVAKEINDKGMIDVGKATETTDTNVLGYFKEILGKNPLQMKEYFKLYNIEIGVKGAEELEYIFSNSKLKTQNSKLVIDYSLARGLNYYTGAIFEVKANAGTLTSSITGGGRYDNLTGVFGLSNVSGVGISFGVDRIFDVMNELNLYPETVASSTKVMFVNFGPAEEKYALPLLAKVRAAGINSEIYPDHAKIKKQFDYANKKQIPFVVVIGSEEMQSGQLTLKNMNSGEQEKLSIEELVQKVK